MPMAMVKGALKRLEIIRTEKQHLENLWKIVHALQSGLKEKGFDIGGSNTPVTPVMLKGDLAEASGVVHDLRENYKIFCSVVIYPVIPKGMILLRLIPTAVHSLADVEETIKAFSEIREKLTSGAYDKIVSMGEQH
jgi:glycine C-acetyltransferase